MGDFDDDAAKTAAMAEEMRQEDIAEGREPLEWSPPGGQAEVEPYDPERHGVPQAPDLPAYDPDIHGRLPDDTSGMPDINEDPVAHFQARFEALEQQQRGAAPEGQYAQAAIMLEHIKQSENAFREEISDYDDATRHLEQGRIDELARHFPDTQQTAVLARQNGFRTPADFRAAILERDRHLCINHAMQLGMNPAEYYYRLACERGYRPSVGITRSGRRKLAQELDRAHGDDFDKAWARAKRAGMLG